VARHALSSKEFGIVRDGDYMARRERRRSRRNAGRPVFIRLSERNAVSSNCFSRQHLTIPMAKNVLLIEYEQRDRSRILSLLAAPDYAVTETHDGEEGLAAFGSAPFDLVLLSGKLPRLSPADVIRDIRKKGGAAAPPIVLLAADYSGSNTKADAQKIGAFEIVPKPFTDDALLGAVHSALESTDVGAKTQKVPTASRALTANDIFADLLDELGKEATPLAPPAARAAAKEAPVPPPAPRTPPARTASADEEIERRLRDTLSGVRMTTRPGTTRPGTTGPGTTPHPEGAAPAPTVSAVAKSSEAASRAPASRGSSADAIDRMLAETLRIPVAKKPAPAPAPPAAREAVTDATPTPSRRAEPREAVPPSGPDRFGQYELLERIASGGMAELFRARRSGVEGFQKIVAIKKILPHIADNDEFITMFADEAKVAAQLNHPNIVHIYDLGKIEAGGYFIAMEYVEGTDLRTILRTGREVGTPLPIPLAVYVASKVASALDYAHRRRDARGEELRIVHRDVSPQNILISYEGEIKLCDFGIAKADRKVSRTESGSLKGKLQYMSPEQAWGKPIDHRSDLFSLGCVLHEMLTGERLFRGDSDMTILELVRKADVPPPSRINPDVPAALDQIVLKALAREPGDRYGTGSEMLRDLEAILYSYTPAPGSADVAIYLNRLREAKAAPAPETLAAPRPAAAEKPARRPKEAEVPPVKSRPAGLPTSEAAAAGSTVSPEPEAKPADVFGSFSAARVESEKRGRLPLYAGLAAVVVVGIALALIFGRRGASPAAPAVSPTPAPAAPVAAAPAVEPPPPPAGTPGVVSSASLDPKAIQQEVQRQLAEKRLAAQKSTLARATPVPTRAAPAVMPPTEAPRPEPTFAPPPTLAPPEPTEVAVAAPPTGEPAERVGSREQVAAPAVEQVSRGDLVGPGPGVVEPALISPPRVNYPPLARQQRVTGRVVILVLVNDNGGVAEARVQSGVGGRSGLDGAVLDAVRSSRFRAATKNGIPVKMWRTVVVDVKP
jgi:TonB family protein